MFCSLANISYCVCYNAVLVLSKLWINSIGWAVYPNTYIYIYIWPDFEYYHSEINSMHIYLLEDNITKADKMGFATDFEGYTNILYTTA